MKKINYTFQIETGKAEPSGEMAYQEIFERGLSDAKQSIRTMTYFGFRWEYMVSCAAGALNMLKESKRGDSQEAVKLADSAVDCVRTAQVQLQMQHDSDNVMLKERFESITYAGEDDVRYEKSSAELKEYCREFSEKAMSILNAYDGLVELLGGSGVWLETYATIIALGEKFIQDVFDEYSINDKLSFSVLQETHADEMLEKWRSKLSVVEEEIRKEEERRRKEEEERRERERKLEEERLKKEAEERARREAQEAAERIRREAEEAAERARKEAAERIAREQKQEQEREAYELLVDKLNKDITDKESQKASIKKEYDELTESLGTKLADQDAEVNLLNQLKQSQEEIETELTAMREERMEKMARYTKLGVFAGAEKKNIKIELDRLDIEIAGKESKLNSYKREVESVERRVSGKDNGSRMRLKSMQQDMDQIDADIAAIRKRMEDEKPEHMR